MLIINITLLKKEKKKKTHSRILGRKPKSSIEERKLFLYQQSQ